MKYQIGDDIIVLHSNEEGKVIDIIDEKMIMIEVRGVKFPAYMDQIDFPYFYRFSKKKIVEETKPVKVFIDNIPKEKPQPNQLKTADGVWLVFIPKFSFDEFDDDYVELLKIHLVNKTNTAYKFAYDHQLQGKSQFQLENQIQAYHDFYLHDIAFETVNDSPSFDIDFSLVETNKLKNDHFEASLKLKPKQVFQRIQQMKKNNEPTFAYQLFEEYPDRVFEEYHDIDKLAKKGFKIYDLSKIKEHLEPARSVIDLHIEKLVDNFQGKSSLEILTIQLKEFEKWYDLAVANKQPNFIVIHGIGKGKLKEEIHQLLKLRKEVKYFVNQYDERFGYGATEIFFQ
ncbi:MAG: Smr/MutS family protein [Chitinophagaceae bacterium]